MSNYRETWRSTQGVRGRGEDLKSALRLAFEYMYIVQG